MDERRELFADVLALSMQDSVRVWLVNQLGFTAYRGDVSVSTDLAGGLNGARLWPYTLLRTGEEGGTLTIAMPSMLPEPWNPRRRHQLDLRHHAHPLHSRSGHNARPLHGSAVAANETSERKLLSRKGCQSAAHTTGST